jgi:hypothetical protein
VAFENLPKLTDVKGPNMVAAFSSQARGEVILVDVLLSGEQQHLGQCVQSQPAPQR